MVDPIGAVALVITGIQAGYNAYRAYKLTEAFGTDFRQFQRRFESQINRLRWEAVRLRKEAVFYLGSNVNDAQEWSQYVRKLLVHIMINIESCQRLAEKYERAAQESRNVKSKGKPSDIINAKQSKTVLAKTADGVNHKTSTDSTNVNRKPRHLFRNISFKKADTPSEEVSSIKLVPTEVSKWSLLSIFDQPGVCKNIHQEKDLSEALQEGTSLRLRLEWVIEDRNEYRDCLCSIADAIKELQHLVTSYIEQATASNVSNTKDSRTISIFPQRHSTLEIRQSGMAYSTLLAHYTEKSEDMEMEDMAPLPTETYQCQEAFYRLYADLRSLWPNHNLCVRLYYDHYGTQEELQPCQTVSTRKDSLVFLLQCRLGDTADENLLLVADTPILRRSRTKAAHNPSGVDRLLKERIQKGPLLQGPLQPAKIELDNDEPLVCLGSLEMSLSQAFRISERCKSREASSIGGCRGREVLQHLDHVTPENRNPTDGQYYQDPSSATIAREGDVDGDLQVLGEPSSVRNSPQHTTPDEEFAVIKYEPLRRSVFHHIYQDRKSLWRQETSLENFLLDSSFRRPEYAHLHVRLAALLAKNYVSLGFHGNAQVFRPQDCLYFRPASEHDPPIDELLLLSPSLHIRPGNSTRIGTGLGIPSPKRQALLELGLLLYQIGSWKRIDYNHPGRLPSLIQSSLLDLQSVVDHVGSAFADVVYFCLAERIAHRSFSIYLPPGFLHQWPRYCTEEVYHRIVAHRESHRTYNPCSLSGTRALSEALEIWHYVVKPLERLWDRDACIDAMLYLSPSSSSETATTDEDDWYTKSHHLHVPQVVLRRPHGHDDDDDDDDDLPHGNKQD